MQELSAGSKVKIEAVLKMAAEDVGFREKLMNDTEVALSNTNLNEVEKSAVKSLRRVSLEEIGVDVRQFRAVLRDNGAKVSASSFAVNANTKA